MVLKNFLGVSWLYIKSFIRSGSSSSHRNDSRQTSFNIARYRAIAFLIKRHQKKRLKDDSDFERSEKSNTLTAPLSFRLEGGTSANYKLSLRSYCNGGVRTSANYKLPLRQHGGTSANYKLSLQSYCNGGIGTSSNYKPLQALAPLFFSEAYAEENIGNLKAREGSIYTFKKLTQFNQANTLRQGAGRVCYLMLRRVTPKVTFCSYSFLRFIHP